MAPTEVMEQIVDVWHILVAKTSWPLHSSLATNSRSQAVGQQPLLILKWLLTMVLPDPPFPPQVHLLPESTDSSSIHTNNCSTLPTELNITSDSPGTNTGPLPSSETTSHNTASDLFLDQNSSSSSQKAFQEANPEGTP